MAKDGIKVHVYGDYDDKDIKKAIRDLRSLGSTSEQQSGKMSTLGKVGAVAAAAGVAIAAKATYDFAKASVSAAQEAQVADARLKSVATSMGLVSGAYAGSLTRLNQYSTSLSKSIGVEDESIKAVQAKLMTFKALAVTVNDTGGAMDRATQAAYDLAAAGFGSAESNAVQLGKALQDPIKGLTALGRAGVTFTADEKERIKTLVESGKIGEAQTLVLAAIESQVGGTAAATATATDKMKVAFGELQESVGGALLPAFQTLAEALVPIFEGLQGPLTEVAKTIADSLGKALQSLLPILPTLATALGQIVGVIGDLLVTAINVLLPVMTPMLEILGDLATRVGPILKPILEKSGEVLGRLFTAVMPLIAPLTDLVFTILEAAMPIIDIVADLFTVLIDALAPLIGVVASLLPTLGELVQVLFKAVEPILRPLLPLIAALAAVFGDVLARAIGVIVAAFGGMLNAASKIYPFILNNVIVPVLSAFLDWAANMVGAAEAAFGWIPGLGDKLGTAKKAIGTFKTDAVKAVGNAADLIGKEGARIGESLIDQGVALMSDPAQVQRLNAAGQNAGLGLAGGLANGIYAGYNVATTAATKLGYATGAAMISATRDGWEARMLPKLPAAPALPPWLPTGVGGGGGGGGGGGKSATDKFVELNKAMKATLGTSVAFGKSASTLSQQLGGNLIAKFSNGVLKAGKVTKETVSEFESLVSTIKDNLNKALDEANGKLQKAQDTFNSYRDAIANGITQGNTLSDAANSQADALERVAEAQKAYDTAVAEGDSTKIAEANTALAEAKKSQKGFLGFLQVGSDTAAGFASQIDSLRLAGASLEVVQQVAELGAKTGGRIIAELLAGGAAAIARANELTQAVRDAASRAGTAAAQQFHGAGVTAAQAFVDAIKATIPVLQGVLDDIADMLAKALGTKVNGSLGDFGSPATAPSSGGGSVSVAPYISDADYSAIFDNLANWAGINGLTPMATGGIVTSPTRILAGEAGAEAIIPLDRLGAMSGGGNTYNITVQAGVGDPRLIGQSIIEYVKSFESSNGNVWSAA